MNIHNYLCAYMEVLQSVKALLVAALRGLKLQKVVKLSCLIFRTLNVLSVISPDMLDQTDVIILMDRQITSQQLSLQLSVSNGSDIEIIKAVEFSDGFPKDSNASYSGTPF